MLFHWESRLLTWHNTIPFTEWHGRGWPQDNQGAKNMWHLNLKSGPRMQCGYQATSLAMHMLANVTTTFMSWLPSLATLCCIQQKSTCLPNIFHIWIIPSVLQFLTYYLLTTQVLHHAEMLEQWPKWKTPLLISCEIHLRVCRDDSWLPGCQ